MIDTDAIECVVERQNALDLVCGDRLLEDVPDVERPAVQF